MIMIVTWSNLFSYKKCEMAVDISKVKHKCYHVDKVNVIQA